MSDDRVLQGNDIQIRRQLDLRRLNRRWRSRIGVKHVTSRWNPPIAHPHCRLWHDVGHCDYRDLPNGFKARDPPHPVWGRPITAEVSLIEGPETVATLAEASRSY